MKEFVEKLRKDLGDEKGDFPKAYIFDSGKYEYLYYFKYRKKKADGTFTKKMYEKGVIVKYNPFTGEKL